MPRTGAADIADLHLYWVIPDPERERAVDPLGLSAQADRIADQLLPGLSVQTRRARYLSFFCWAIRRTSGQRHQLSAIHRLEAELACEEAELHRQDPPEVCPNVVGRQRARQYLTERGGAYPPRPEGLYKNLAFWAYRPLMRALALISSAERRLELTAEGERLASAYHHDRGRAPRCLSAIGTSERTIIRRLLGLDPRTAANGISSAAGRRRSTLMEVHRLFEGGVSVPELLERYATLVRSPSLPAKQLHRAFVWETLSLGLALAFAMLLETRNLAEVSRRFRAMSGKPARWRGLESISPGDDIAASQALALLRCARGFDMPELGLDTLPMTLVDILLGRGDVDRFLSCLVERHAQAKGGEAWVAIEKGRLRVLSQKKNLDLKPAPRSYRLDAFAQILRDLGLLS